MKKLIISLVMVLLLVSIPMVSFAGTVEKDGISVTTTTDKDSYSVGDTVKISVTTTNLNISDVAKVKVNLALPTSMKLNEGQANSIEVGDLKAGETKNYEFEATVLSSSGSNNDGSNDDSDDDDDEDIDEVVGTPVSNASTGDSMGIAFWIVLFAVAAAGATVLYRKGKINKNVGKLVLAFIIGLSLVAVPTQSLKAAGPEMRNVVSDVGAKVNDVDETINVNVDYEFVPLEAINLDKDEVALVVGQSADITATIVPANATVKEIVWSTENMTTATPMGKSLVGTITGVTPGATVAKATVGDLSDTCKVNVTADVVYNINIDNPQIPEEVSTYSVTVNANPHIVLGLDDQNLTNFMEFAWGYTLLGWSTTPTGAVEYQPGDNLQVEAAVVNLYAVWSKNILESVDLGDDKRIHYSEVATDYLYAVANPDSLADVTFEYESSNTTVATIDSDSGELNYTGNLGTTTITVTATQGDVVKTDSIDITVYANLNVVDSFDGAFGEVNLSFEFPVLTGSEVENGVMDILNTFGYAEIHQIGFEMDTFDGIDDLDAYIATLTEDTTIYVWWEATE